MRTTFDFAPLWRSTIGFDHLAGLVDGALRHTSEDNYPPYNIERSGENHYRISLAVAGFGADDINVTAEQNALTIEAGSPRRPPANICTRHCGASVPARVQPGRACPGQAGLFQGWALDHRLGPRGPGGHEAAPDRNRERRIFPLADRAETGSLTARSRLMITGRGAPTHKTRSSSHA